MANDGEKINLDIVSFNMHGFMQGYCVLEELISDCRPDIFMLQEHWLTPANLNKFDNYFPDYLSFGCSAMTRCVESGMLRGRPFGGVMTLIHKRLINLVETIHCEERFTVVRVANYLLVNIYLPCAGSVDRLLICEDLLASISAWRERYIICECIIVGNFNTNLDNSNSFTKCVNKFLCNCLLQRCDNIFPNRKSVTYVNEALKQESCIDYALISAECDLVDFAVLSPDINFSDHLPLRVTVACCTSDNSQPVRNGVPSNVKQSNLGQHVQLQLRWDHGDKLSFYEYTGNCLHHLLVELDSKCARLSDRPNYCCYHDLQHQRDLEEFIDYVYDNIASVLLA